MQDISSLIEDKKAIELGLTVKNLVAMILEQPTELNEQFLDHYKGFDDQQKSDIIMFILKLKQDIVELNEDQSPYR